MERLKINGNGAKLMYGFVLEEGNYPQLFQGLKVKAKYSYNWNDGDGEEVDSNESTQFESINFTFSLIFSCGTLANFSAKYNAFVTALKASNGSLWEFVELSKTYRLHLQELSFLQDIDLLNGCAKIMVTLKYNW